jgi:small subunit ribosomal protein S5
MQATEEKKVEDKKDVKDAPKVGSRDSRGGSREKRNDRRPRRRQERSERPKPEFDQKIIGIRRVTRVMAGGRRFSFSVCMVAGDRKGRVGVGLGKAGDTALAIEKAFRKAKASMVTIPLTENGSIPHEVKEKFCASEIMMMPAPGRGLKAGCAMRAVLELGGVTDVSAKILSRSKNSFNNARATLKALEDLNNTKK